MSSSNGRDLLVQLEQLETLDSASERVFDTISKVQQRSIYMGLIGWLAGVGAFVAVLGGLLIGVGGAIGGALLPSALLLIYIFPIRPIINRIRERRRGALSE